MKELNLNVKGMHCEGCENRIKRGLSSLENILEVEANHEEGLVKIKYENNLNIDLIKNKLVDLGFEVN